MTSLAELKSFAKKNKAKISPEDMEKLNKRYKQEPEDEAK